MHRFCPHVENIATIPPTQMHSINIQEGESLVAKLPCLSSVLADGNTPVMHSGHEDVSVHVHSADMPPLQNLP
jgi:hypothetical protein